MPRVAERVGFEPTCPFGQDAFEAPPLRPLRYLSALSGPRKSQELPSISAFAPATESAARSVKCRRTTMVFTKHLREGIKRGRITYTIRFWTHAHVKAGG